MAGRADQLQLAHLTALTQLLLQDYGHPRCMLAPAEQLPPNLQTLHLYHGGDSAGHNDGSDGSLQPLLALSQLQSFELRMHCGAPPASELAALSSISSLAEVKLVYLWHDLNAGHMMAPHLCAPLTEAAADVAASAWLTLPMKSLHWISYSMPAAVVQLAGALQGLTSLQLSTNCEDADDGLVPAQLAAMLQR
uniref:Uncharacterized protein n=1 Tax=Tetradesmus obliquus TaxID=3088 RepID=A0A383W4A6_TETOB|eukprot:jgi/Sobl393_1/17321/SZX71969.1